MRQLWEVFLLLAGIGVILALAKGFPGFGRILFFLVANPLGLLLTIGLIAWIALRRRRSTGSKSANTRE